MWSLVTLLLLLSGTAAWASPHRHRHTPTPTPTATPTFVPVPTATATETPTAIPTMTPIATINVSFAGTIDPGTTWTIELPTCPASYPIHVSGTVDLADTSGDRLYATITDTDGPMEISVAVTCDGAVFSATQALTVGDIYSLGTPPQCGSTPLAEFDVSTLTAGALTGQVTNNMKGVLNFTTTSVCGS